MPPRVPLGRGLRVLGLVLFVVLHEARAAAQSRFELPEGCGSEEEFRSEIARLTGSPTAADALSSLAIEPLPSESDGFELRLELGTETRLLRDLDCRVLFRSAIVITAAAARSEASGAPSAAPELPAPEPPEPLPPAPLPPAPPALAVPAPPAAPSSAARSEHRPSPRWATTPRERRNARLARARYAASAARADTDAPAPVPIAPTLPASPPPAPPRDVVAEEPSRDEAAPTHRFGVDVGVGVSSGVLPDVGAALELGARFERRPWGAALSFRYWPQRAGGRDGRGLDVSALGGRAAAQVRIAPVLDAVLGLELNRLAGEGAQDVSGRSTDRVWQVAPILGFNMIAWKINQLRIEVGAIGRLSIQRPRFVVTGFGDLYRVPVVGGDAIIRGVWLFR